MNRLNVQSCIDACTRCAQECENCANMCLEEDNVQQMRRCIQLERDCADACWGAASLMSRNSDFMNDMCKLCAEICDACGAECRKHDMDHCQTCADACEQCAEECRRMAGSAV